jgi:hypothetical protein
VAILTAPATNATATLYVDGRVDGTVSTGGASGAALDTVSFGGRRRNGSSDLFCACTLLQFAFYHDRLLTAHDAAWLAVEPYAFFAPPGPARWYSFPAAAAPAGQPTTKRMGGTLGGRQIAPAGAHAW